MSAAAALKKQLSETFAQQLIIPPTIDQLAPEALAATLGKPEPEVALRVVDVRQPSEFASGHVAQAVNLPMDSFDAAALVKAVAEDASNGKKPLVVFVSSQSPDIDANCALTFVREWDEQGLDAKTSLPGASIVATLLGGVVYWLQQYRADATLTEAYDAATWDAVLAARAAADDAASP